MTFLYLVEEGTTDLCPDVRKKVLTERHGWAYSKTTFNLEDFGDGRRTLSEVKSKLAGPLGVIYARRAFLFWD